MPQSRLRTYEIRSDSAAKMGGSRISRFQTTKLLGAALVNLYMTQMISLLRQAVYAAIALYDMTDY